MFNMFGDPGYTQQALNIVKTHRNNLSVQILSPIKILHSNLYQKHLKHYWQYFNSVRYFSITFPKNVKLAVNI